MSTVARPATGRRASASPPTREHDAERSATTLVVHEWVESTGGSEKVVDALLDSFPASELLCLWNDQPTRFGRTAVHETWLGRTPLRRSKVASMALMPMTWRRVSTRAYDRVLISSHLFAHHIAGNPALAEARRFVYVHTPARYIWAPEHDRRGNSMPARVAGRLLRPVDRRAARNDASIAVNSAFVRDRVARAWDRDAVVIHPPVEARRIARGGDWADALSEREADVLRSLPQTFLLGASRLVAYKRLDVVLRVAARVGMPAVIAGSGPDRARLVEVAAQLRIPVVFVDAPSDALLYALYARAFAYVFPPVEDFGIMPVEAMATGCPVIVNRVGGASESLLEGVTGFAADPDDRTDVAARVASVGGLDRQRIREHALGFDRTAFQDRVQGWVR